ncbi:MAG TPA: glycosyltransferase [Beijerinckiaceae bacterium]|nr:glycosyltransferase [Beijerinckiaceae bacterium]
MTFLQSERDGILDDVSVVRRIARVGFRIPVFGPALRWALLSALRTVREVTSFSRTADFVVRGSLTLLKTTRRLPGGRTLFDRVWLPLARGSVVLAEAPERPLSDFSPLLERDAFSGGPIVLCNNALAWGGVERQIVNTLNGLAAETTESLGLLCVRLDAGPDYGFYLPSLDGFRGFVRNAVTPGEAAARINAMVRADRAGDLSAQIAWLPSHVQEEVRRFVGEFLTLKPSVVHVWQDALSISAGMAAKLVGVPKIIVASRNMAARRFAYHQPYMATGYRELAACPDVVFLNNSEAGARDYAGWLGILPDRFELLRNGVDEASLSRPPSEATAALKARLGIPPDAPVLGSVFRFYDEKQPMLWVQAAGIVAKALPQTHFVVFGTGPLMGEVWKFAERQGFADRLHLPGTIEDVALGVSLFDAFMLTSQLEGTPNVVLEASLLGVPVVATNAGGTVEAIADGLTGYVARHGQAEALAELVLKVLRDPIWPARAREHGPSFISQRFGLKRMIDETVALYGLKRLK